MSHEQTHWAWLLKPMTVGMVLEWRGWTDRLHPHKDAAGPWSLQTHTLSLRLFLWLEKDCRMSSWSRSSEPSAHHQFLLPMQQPLHRTQQSDGSLPAVPASGVLVTSSMSSGTVGPVSPVICVLTKPCTPIVYRCSLGPNNPKHLISAQETLTPSSCVALSQRGISTRSHRVHTK